MIAAVFGVEGTLGQAPPPPPAVSRPTAKPTPAERSELTSEQFEARIVESLKKPVAWKRYAMQGFDIAFDMPRDPIRQTEWFYEEAVGNTKMEMHVSVGDGATYLVGQMLMPYAIKDRKLIRESFEELAKGVSKDKSIDFRGMTEFEFSGHPGIEMSVPAKKGYMSPIVRGLMIGRGMYLIISFPHHAPPADSALLPADITEFQKDNDRFISSIVLNAEASPKVTAVSTSRVFASSIKDGVFTSEYFKFSLTLPAGWNATSEEEAEGIQKVGKDFIGATSSVKVATDRVRRNLATFLSKPLGSEETAGISINVATKPSPTADVRGLVDMTANLIKTLPTYRITKQPVRVKLAGMDAYTMESTIKYGDGDQYQIIYVLDRRGHAITITVGYYTDSERLIILKALEGIRFEPL